MGCARSRIHAAASREKSAGAIGAGCRVRCLKGFVVSRFAKRSMDFVVASAALLIFAPLLAIIALAIWLAMGRPVLFRQVRSGYKGKLFTLTKFRTMTNAHDAQGRLLSDVERLTALGKFLRRISLDELPQLWNVWKRGFKPGRTASAADAVFGPI